MYYVITRNATFVAITTESPYEWNLPDVSIHKFESDIMPDLNRSIWDATTENFIISTHVYTKLQFLNLFTTTERIAVRSSQDLVVQDFLNLLSLAEYVDNRDQNTIDAINYIAQVGLITQVRASEILA